MGRPKKPKEEHLQLVAGKVEPDIKEKLAGLLPHLNLRSESEYVRRAVTAQVKRDCRRVAEV